ncbi:MAG: DUF5703 domain-containing protein [bacterium]
MTVITQHTRPQSAPRVRMIVASVFPRIVVLFAAMVALGRPLGWAAEVKSVKSLDDCNVVWASPSTNSFGSMPLGNGDVGANVWVEPNGDLLFYISKSDAFDGGHELKKLGRIRVTFDPPLAVWRGVTILKLEYDRPVEEFARAAPSKGSLTSGTNETTVAFGHPVTIERLEVTIDNPGHRRGQGKQLELQVQQPEGTWRTVHAGLVFGSIYSRSFSPAKAQSVRLKIDAAVRQFDLWAPET